MELETRRECEFCKSDAVRFVVVKLPTGTFAYGYCLDHGPARMPSPRWVSSYDVLEIAIGGKRPRELEKEEPNERDD